MNNSSINPSINDGEAGITEPSDHQISLKQPGKLVFVKGGVNWSPAENSIVLRHGENTLGRQSPHSTSSIQIPTDDRNMSRYQVKIDVVETPDGRYVHHFSHVGDKKNTFHNGKELEKGEVIILTPGDTICMGCTTFMFMD